MERFPAAWLSLREAADARSRNETVAAALRRAFAAHAVVNVVDLGCGTGANLRATSVLLGPVQNWSLVDNDPMLLAGARTQLVAWADNAVQSGDALQLRKRGRTIDVRFHNTDLAGGLENAFGERPDLVTASAFFDLVSAAFIDRFVRIAARYGAAIYATLIYNGRQSWSPSHRMDETMRQAFNAHQASDKGFGPAAGPLGAEWLARGLEALKCQVVSGDSPWRLGSNDTALLSELSAGVAAAVAETGTVEPRDIEAWSATPRLGAQIGHTDILGLTSAPSR